MEIRSEEEGEMLTMLYDASMEGSLRTFNSLIQKDPLILSKISLTTFNETPLHISALLGHLAFTRQLLSHKPKLALETDSLKRLPLHLASAEGHTDIVRVLLQEHDGDQDMCLAKDQDGKIPLHYAAMRGRIDVIELLINAEPGSIFEVIPDHGETVLHLCVKYNHLEALKVLVKSTGIHENKEFLNLKEHAGGNTVLLLAVSLKQVETVKYLLSVPGVKAGVEGAMNHEGINTSKLLKHSSSTDFNSLKIRQIFMDAGLAITQEHQVAHEESTTKLSSSKARRQRPRSWFGFMKYKGNWMEDRRGSIMVVATVISTMTFQTAINPPGGIWQQNTNVSIGGPFDCSENNICIAGTSVLARADPNAYTGFMIYNSTSFVASLSVILLLISGVPLKNKFYMFVLTVTMCVAVVALDSTFVQGMNAVTPDNTKGPLLVITYVSTATWLLLLGFIILVHTIRLLVWVAKKLWRMFTCKGVHRKKDSGLVTV